MNVALFIAALQALPITWLAQDFERVRVSQFAGRIIISHPDMMPMSFDDARGEWEIISTIGEYCNVHA